MPSMDRPISRMDHLKRLGAGQQGPTRRPGVPATPRRALAATSLAAALLAALPVAASAGNGSTQTFAGSCSFSGTVVFHPPLTNATQSFRQVADLVGTCTGTYTTKEGGTPLKDEPVVYHATSSGEGSCAGDTATGAGYLEIRGRKLRFGLRENRVAAASLITLDGEGGGSFDGVAQPNGGDDPGTILEECNGAGLRSSAVGLHGQTSSPISG
jgi:hypothetical protein